MTLRRTLQLRVAGVVPGAVLACAPTPIGSNAPASSSSPAAASPVASPASASGSTPLLSVRSVPPGPSTAGSAVYSSTPIAERPPLPARYSQPVGPYGLYLEVVASASPSQFGLLAS